MLQSTIRYYVCGLCGQAPYGWPSALGLTGPAAGGLFTDHQTSSALGVKVAPADATNKRSPDLQQRFQLLHSLTSV